jgi:hypothetical protein
MTEHQLSEHWVVDATASDGMEAAGLYVFCPIVEGDPGQTEVMVGLSFISSEPPGPLCGIIHEGGEEAAQAWARAHPDLARFVGPAPNV